MKQLMYLKKKGGYFSEKYLRHLTTGEILILDDKISRCGEEYLKEDVREAYRSILDINDYDQRAIKFYDNYIKYRCNPIYHLYALLRFYITGRIPFYHSGILFIISICLFACFIFSVVCNIDMIQSGKGITPDILFCTIMSIFCVTFGIICVTSSVGDIAEAVNRGEREYSKVHDKYVNSANCFTKVVKNCIDITEG